MWFLYLVFIIKRAPPYSTLICFSCVKYKYKHWADNCIDSLSIIYIKTRMRNKKNQRNERHIFCKPHIYTFHTPHYILSYTSESQWMQILSVLMCFYCVRNFSIHIINEWRLDVVNISNLLLFCTPQHKLHCVKESGGNDDADEITTNATFYIFRASFFPFWV